jgi:DNA polymerase-3 subunit alpha
MDHYRTAVKKAGAVPIGAILADFAQDGGNVTFRDDQLVTLAGVISAVKTKTTKNNSLMAYITLEDGTGSMELLAFQRALDTGGAFVRDNLAVVITGRLSARDEKEPQLVIDTIRPITDFDNTADIDQIAETAMPRKTERKLYVRLRSENDPACERIRLILVMFPGNEQMVLYFEDTKKRRGARCVIHEALVDELKEMLGDENVVVK